VPEIPEAANCPIGTAIYTVDAACSGRDPRRIESTTSAEVCSASGTPVTRYILSSRQILSLEPSIHPGLLGVGSFTGITIQQMKEKHNILE
jgi:hypothetical protein